MIQKSRTFKLIQKLDREELELAFFFCVASMRSMAKGESQLPPKTADRYVLALAFSKAASLALEKGPEKLRDVAYAKAASSDQDPVDLSQAAELLAKIGKASP